VKSWLYLKDAIYRQTDRGGRITGRLEEPERNTGPQEVTVDVGHAMDCSSRCRYRRSPSPSVVLLISCMRMTAGSGLLTPLVPLVVGWPRVSWALVPGVDIWDNGSFDKLNSVMQVTINNGKSASVIDLLSL